MSRVIVLHGPPPGHASEQWQSGLLHRLPYARRLALEALDMEARRASLAGTALLFKAAGQLGYDAVDAGDLRYPQGAKPSVAGGPYFSIAHTPRRVACAACCELDLGLDHEDYSGVQPPERLRHWTAVEATLKAAGAGLRRARAVEVDPELRYSTLDGREFQLVPLDFGAGAVACLAVGTMPDAVEIRFLEDVAA